MKTNLVCEFWVLWQPATFSSHGRMFREGNAFCSGYVESNDIISQVSKKPWVLDYDEEFGDNDGCLSCMTFDSLNEAYEISRKLSQSGVEGSHFIPRLVQTITPISENGEQMMASVFFVD